MESTLFQGIRVDNLEDTSSSSDGEDDSEGEQDSEDAAEVHVKTIGGIDNHSEEDSGEEISENTDVKLKQPSVTNPGALGGLKSLFSTTFKFYGEDRGRDRRDDRRY